MSSDEVFPQDIFVEIQNHIDDIPTLCALSATCTALTTCTRSCLFRELKFGSSSYQYRALLARLESLLGIWNPSLDSFRPPSILSSIRSVSLFLGRPYLFGNVVRVRKPANGRMQHIFDHPVFPEFLTALRDNGIWTFELVMTDVTEWESISSITRTALQGLINSPHLRSLKLCKLHSLPSDTFHCPSLESLCIQESPSSDEGDEIDPESTIYLPQLKSLDTDFSFLTSPLFSGIIFSSKNSNSCIAPLRRLECLSIFNEGPKLHPLASWLLCHNNGSLTHLRLAGQIQSTELAHFRNLTGLSDLHLQPAYLGSPTEPLQTTCHILDCISAPAFLAKLTITLVVPSTGTWEVGGLIPNFEPTSGWCWRTLDLKLTGGGFPVLRKVILQINIKPQRFNISDHLDQMKGSDNTGYCCGPFAPLVLDLLPDLSVMPSVLDVLFK